MPRPLPSDVAAYPDSVNVLSDVSGDIRTPDKLVDGVNDTYDGRHMWLAPILPHTVSVPYLGRLRLAGSHTTPHCECTIPR